MAHPFVLVTSADAVAYVRPTMAVHAEATPSALVASMRLCCHSSGPIAVPHCNPQQTLRHRLQARRHREGHLAKHPTSRMSVLHRGCLSMWLKRMSGSGKRLTKFGMLPRIHLRPPPPRSRGVRATFLRCYPGLPAICSGSQPLHLTGQERLFDTASHFTTYHLCLTQYWDREHMSA